MTNRHTDTHLKNHEVDFSQLEVFDTDRNVPQANRPYILQLKVDKVAYEFAGMLIGWSTSESATHRDHPDTDYAPKGVKCSACRWLEVELYIRFGEITPDGTDPDVYVVVTRGPSMIETETDYEKITFTESGYEVIELLTVRKGQNSFIPPQHMRALAQAANFDARIEDIYTNMIQRPQQSGQR